MTAERRDDHDRFLVGKDLPRAIDFHVDRSVFERFDLADAAHLAGSRSGGELDHSIELRLIFRFVPRGNAAVQDLFALKRSAAALGLDLFQEVEPGRRDGLHAVDVAVDSQVARDGLPIVSVEILLVRVLQPENIFRAFGQTVKGRAVRAAEMVFGEDDLLAAEAVPAHDVSA